MTEDKLFNLLVARTQTRETSTLAITVIAASASLILLGFVCPINVEQRIPFVIMGIIYPILGMLYREYTYLTIQNSDFEQIRRHFSDEEEDIVRGGYSSLPRRVLFYLLFVVIPIAGWVLILTTNIC